MNIRSRSLHNQPAALLLMLPLMGSDAIAQCDAVKLISPSPGFRAYAGVSVGIELETCLLGAPAEQVLQVQSGASYSVVCDESGLETPALLLPASVEEDDYYGVSVGVSAQWVAVGSIYDDDAAFNAGAVYMFRGVAGQWALDCKLIASDASQAAQFGGPLSLEGNHLLVAAPADNTFGSSAGKAYLLEYVNGAWLESEILVPGDIDGGWWFGASVDLSDKVAAIGAPNRAGCVFASGAAYVFEKVNGTWIETARLCGLDSAEADKFGCAVAVSGKTVLVGAPYHAASGSYAGAVYVFEKSGLSWTQTDKLLPPEYPADGVVFGRSLAFEGDRVIVGAEYGDGIEPDSGTVYVFERRPSGWTFVRKIQAPDGATSDQFGVSVDLSSHHVIVGAAGDDHSGHEDAGSAWLYQVGTGETYCSIESNSTGAPALISAVGTASVTHNELVLAATPLPGQTGLFYLGTTQIELPFGNGWRCVGGQIVRLSPRLPEAGVLREQLDFETPPLAGRIVPGSRWNVQAWYRDPMAGGAFFNTSNALSVVFEP